MRNRVRVMCKPGSVGDLGGQPPRSTRPITPTVVGHTHQPMWYRSPEGGLVVNPGSVVSMPVVDLSRTFAVADLANLNVTFHAVESGEPIPLAPWD